MRHTIKEIVTDNFARINYICNGIVYYTIDVMDSVYQLEIDSNSEEWRMTYLQPEFKAITLMRWIRQSIDNKDDKFMLIR